MDFPFGTQIQGAQEDLEEASQAKAITKSRLAKFAFKDVSAKQVRTYARPKKTTRKRPAKTKSISAKVAKKFKGESPEKETYDNLYREEEWNERISQLSYSLKRKRRKTRTPRTSQLSQEDKSLWGKSSSTPELNNEEVNVLYGSGDEGETDSSDNSDKVSITLSQLMKDIYGDQQTDKKEEGGTQNDPILLSSKSEDQIVLTSTTEDPESSQIVPEVDVVPAISNLMPHPDLTSPLAKLSGLPESSPVSLLRMKSINQLPLDLDNAEEVSDSTDDSDSLIFLGGKSRQDRPIQTKSIEIREGDPIQVPSSEKEDEEDDSEEAEISDSEEEEVEIREISVDEEINDDEEIPDSQEPAEKVDTSIFEQFSVKQLRRQIAEWGLKPLRSRKEMVKMLQMVCGVIESGRIEESVKQFQLSETTQSGASIDASILRLSQNPTEQSQIVRDSLFVRIRDCLVANEQIHREILTYKPVNIDRVMKCLAENGLEELDSGIVCDCLDRFGICFTSVDN